MDSWNISPPVIPKRRNYTFPPPVGVGTPDSESLSSVVSKTAQIYHITVGTLNNELFIPHLAKPYLKRIAVSGGTGFYKTSWTLNGTCDNADRFSRLISSLSGQEVYQQLTLHPWNKVLSNVHLLRKERVWCPQCFQDAQNAGTDIYEPLLWSIEAVKICTHHKAYLTTKCSSCGAKSQFILNRKTWPGHCSICGAWLGSTKSKNIPQDDRLSSLAWANECAGAIIAATPSLHREPSRKNVATGIAEIIKQYRDGNIADFARSIGVPRNTAWMWQQGSALPRLEALIAVCSCYSIDIVKILTSGQIVEIHKEQGQRKVYSLVRNRRKSRVALDLEAVRVRLLKIASSSKEKPVPMEQIATQFGCSKRFLYQHFSGLCKQISQEYRNDLNHKHNVRIRSSRRDVREVILRMRVDGLKPTYSLMRDKLKKPNMLREKAIREEWFRVRNRSPGRKGAGPDQRNGGRVKISSYQEDGNDR